LGGFSSARVIFIRPSVIEKQVEPAVGFLGLLEQVTFCPSRPGKPVLSGPNGLHAKLRGVLTDLRIFRTAFLRPHQYQRLLFVSVIGF
jgi:hypothetical protein